MENSEYLQRYCRTLYFRVSAIPVGRMRQKIIALFLFLFMLPLTSWAASKPYRVGIVLPGDEWLSSVEGFKEGMKGLGYVEGRDIQYLLESAKGDMKKVSETTKRFVAVKVDAIFTITNTALKVVAEITRASKTPVVFGSASGPVESGIMPAQTTPDTHISGVTSSSIELVGKRLEIVKEVLPQIKRVVVLGATGSDSSEAAFAAAKVAASKLGITIIEFRARSREDAIQASKKITRKEADAVFLIPGLYVVGAVAEIALEAKSARMPFVAYQVEHVKSGALLGYGSSFYLQGKQSALLVDKILKGVHPAKLPFERSRLHQLVLNLDTAEEIGIRFSPEVLNRADELIGGGSKR
ncbi:MAG: ABC transporter substrate-binding protein [Candidatus Binatia bacterium]